MQAEAQNSALQSAPGRVGKLSWWKLDTRPGAEERSRGCRGAFCLGLGILSLVAALGTNGDRMGKAVSDFFTAPVGMKGDATPETVGAAFVAVGSLWLIGMAKNWMIRKK